MHVMSNDNGRDPYTMIKSKTNIKTYKIKTYCETVRPDSSVAGPQSTHGNNPGQRYVITWKFEIKNTLWNVLMMD